MELVCRCGAVRGRLANADRGWVNRARCYCDDCQTAAVALGRPDVLDEHGGTDIIQVYPSCLTITQGQDRIGLLRLSPKGLLRFHTTCCQTPIGNTLEAPSAPFLGIPRAFFADDDATVEAAFGPAAGIQGRFARGGRPPGVPERLSAGVLLRSASFLGRGALFRRHQPNPYRHPDGRPIVAARVLSLDERRAAAPGV